MKTALSIKLLTATIIGSVLPLAAGPIPFPVQPPPIVAQGSMSQYDISGNVVQTQTLFNNGSAPIGFTTPFNGTTSGSSTTPFTYLAPGPTNIPGSVVQGHGTLNLSAVATESSFVSAISTSASTTFSFTGSTTASASGGYGGPSPAPPPADIRYTVGNSGAIARYETLFQLPGRYQVQANGQFTTSGSGTASIEIVGEQQQPIRAQSSANSVTLVDFTETFNAGHYAFDVRSQSTATTPFPGGSTGGSALYNLDLTFTPDPRTFVLSAGVNYPLIPNSTKGALEGGHGALMVGQAFQDFKNVTTDVVDLNNTLSGNVLILESHVRAMEQLVQPGDSFVFYINSHAGYPFSPSYSPATPESAPRLDLSQHQLGSDDALQPSVLASWFNDPVWNSVHKLFIIDACFAGGFALGGTFNDLLSLPSSTIIAASPYDLTTNWYQDAEGHNWGGLGQAVTNTLYNLDDISGLSYSSFAADVAVNGMYFANETGFFQDDRDAFWGTPQPGSWNPVLLGAVDADAGFARTLESSSTVPDSLPATTLLAVLAAMVHLRRLAVKRQI